MINAECRDMDNLVNIKQGRWPVLLITRPFSVKIDMPFIFLMILYSFEMR
jgi:hypothetical protein